MRIPSRPESPQNLAVTAGGQYFDRRGEVSELKQMLRAALSERDASKMRDAIKKVIGYMTLGIDMSRVFSEMVMASQMGDTVQKKMIYLYLTAYAEQNADLAILAVNTLQKDTKDADPSVRGLALRSLCSLRLLNIIEYLAPAIEAGLNDSSSYVRKTAVMGILKLAFDSRIGYVDRLVRIVESDPDVSVVSNGLVVLKELNYLNGSLTETKFVYSLLNKFPLFSEWSRCVVIDNVLSAYIPSGAEELFALMNCLDPYLKQSSIPVAIGIMRLFLNWAKETDILSEFEILDKLKDPIATLFSSSSQSVEMQYALLSEISQFGHVEALFFPQQFFISDLDNMETSKLKISLLSCFIDNDAVVAELQQHVRDPLIGEFAINALVKVGTPETVFRIFLSYAQNAPFCFVGIATLLSRFPDLVTQLQPELLEEGLASREPSVVAAVVWILGQFGGTYFEEAPYLLERVEGHTVELQMALLSCSLKLFFVRPLQTQALLEKLIRQGIDQSAHPDLHDRALMYFRLLKFVGVGRAAAGLKDEPQTALAALPEDILLI